MVNPTASSNGALQSPEEIARLKTLVRNRLSGRIQDIRVIVHGPGLILCGRTQTYHAKQLAQHVLMEAVRLPILANEIEVA
jgi:hypothetical protein